MTRSARARLLDAIRAKADAEEHCPHWDFGGYDVHDLHDCCRDLERALQELALARLAFAKESS